jgi:quercetin dioxygenase-like cupin family protein
VETTLGIRHFSVDDIAWERLDVHGTVMDKATVFEGAYDVRSAFFRLAKGQVIREHTHTKWVQVFVMSGHMHVHQEGSDDFDATPGTVYFLDPGFAHIETAVADTTVLVTQGEDRTEWVHKHLRHQGSRNV